MIAFHRKTGDLPLADPHDGPSIWNWSLRRKRVQGLVFVRQLHSPPPPPIRYLASQRSGQLLIPYRPETTAKNGSGFIITVAAYSP